MVHIRQLMNFLMMVKFICTIGQSENDQDSDATNVQAKEDTKYKHFKLNNSKEDNIPLSDPFELPKNFCPDVASALASGRMTLETNTFFLSTVASAMFPTSDDYRNVARAIGTKYPFMKSPTGKPYVSLGMVCSNLTSINDTGGNSGRA